MTDNLRTSTSGLVSVLVQLATLGFIVLVALCELAIAKLKVALCWVGRAVVSLCDRVPESVWAPILAPPYFLFVALPCLCIIVPCFTAFMLYLAWQEYWNNGN